MAVRQAQPDRLLANSCAWKIGTPFKNWPEADSEAHRQVFKAGKSHCEHIGSALCPLATTKKRRRASSALNFQLTKHPRRSPIFTAMPLPA
jgi:hypothetical protein